MTECRHRSSLEAVTPSASGHLSVALVFTAWSTPTDNGRFPPEVLSCARREGAWTEGVFPSSPLGK